MQRDEGALVHIPVPILEWSEKKKQAGQDGRGAMAKERTGVRRAGMARSQRSQSRDAAIRGWKDGIEGKSEGGRGEEGTSEREREGQKARKIVG
eukprot:3611087-Pleurochrysis_carterae.AAC.1